jgi:hypothetical protein
VEETRGHNIGLYNEKQNDHAVGIVPTSNRKNIERGNIDASAAQKTITPLQVKWSVPNNKHPREFVENGKLTRLDKWPMSSLKTPVFVT